MGNHPRVHTTNLGNFGTTRTAKNCIWFTGDKKLEESILGSLAVCVERYQPKIHAFALVGTHKHEMIVFPEGGQSDFYRDFNTACSKAVKRRYPDLFSGQEGVPVWRRRYSSEHIARDEDLEDKFFYTVLQPVQDGLVDSIYKYPGYNCFEDAIHERKKKYKVVNWAKYNSDKRWKKKISIEDYTREVVLQYCRLPGYEDLSRKEYIALMRKRLKQRVKALKKARRLSGKKYLGRERLLLIQPGTRSENSKESVRGSLRPRIICGCPEMAQRCIKWYKGIIERYREVSLLYRAGQCDPSAFPPGTHPPHLRGKNYHVEATDFIFESE